jgi:arsenate reductase
MTIYTIFHNPRCSKSRQALGLLQERGIEPEVVEYLKTPLSTQTLQNLCEKLGVNVVDMMRTKEREFKELGLGDRGVTDNELLQAMTQNPILLERPIVVCGDKAVIGRPPENVLELI